MILGVGFENKTPKEHLQPFFLCFVKQSKHLFNLSKNKKIFACENNTKKCRL